MLEQNGTGKHMRLVLPIEVHKWVRSQMVVLDESSMAGTIVRLLEGLMGDGDTKSVKPSQKVSKSDKAVRVPDATPVVEPEREVSKSPGLETKPPREYEQTASGFWRGPITKQTQAGRKK